MNGNVAVVRALGDRAEITDQLHRYCRAMDRIDAELGYSIWHEDGTADYGSIFDGTGRGFVDWVCEVHRGMEVHTHRLSNISIALDGDTAGSESYVHVTLRFRNGEQLMETASHGRYIDRWERRTARWAITHRRYIQDIDEVRPVAGTIMASTGRRDRTDASYDVLGSGISNGVWTAST